MRLLLVVGLASGCAVERTIAVEPLESAAGDAALSDETESDVSKEMGGDDVADSPGPADSSSSLADGPSPSEEGDVGSTGSAACTNPVFVTSSPSGIWVNAGPGYNVFNNMWNVDAGPGPQTLYACSYHSWYVVSDQMDNGGAVKTYPNVQMNFASVPIGSLHSVTSTFAETSPHVGFYEVNYDIWINGIAAAGSSQIQVWVDNYNRVPQGSQATTTTLGNRTYDVWRTSDGSNITTLAARVNFTSGNLDLLEIFNWIIAQGWLTASSTLDQICFGAEIVSTGGASATYQVNDFSIASN